MVLILLHNLSSGNVAVFTFGVLLFHSNLVCKTNIFPLKNSAHFHHIDAEKEAAQINHKLEHPVRAPAALLLPVLTRAW